MKPRRAHQQQQQQQAPDEGTPSLSEPLSIFHLLAGIQQQQQEQQMYQQLLPYQMEHLRTSSDEQRARAAALSNKGLGMEELFNQLHNSGTTAGGATSGPTELNAKHAAALANAGIDVGGAARPQMQDGMLQQGQNALLAKLWEWLSGGEQMTVPQ